MKITWLGQCGFFIETCGKKIMVDPYLSDNVYELNGPRFKRMFPIDFSYSDIKPDMILLTHDHNDHTDIPTLKKMLDQEQCVQAIAPLNPYLLLRKTFTEPREKPHNFILLDAGGEWTEGEIHIRSVKAFHSDLSAVGYLITAEGKTVYISGDTVYNAEIIRSIGDCAIDIMFVVMNGKGNNLNAADAARLTRKLKPSFAAPVHWGGFIDYHHDEPQQYVEALAGSGVRSIVPELCKAYDADELIG